MFPIDWTNKIWKESLHRESNNSSFSDEIWKKAKFMTAGTNEYNYEHVCIKTPRFLHNIINSSKTNVSNLRKVIRKCSLKEFKKIYIMKNLMF